MAAEIGWCAACTVKIVMIKYELRCTVWNAWHWYLGTGYQHNRTEVTSHSSTIMQPSNHLMKPSWHHNMTMQHGRHSTMYWYYHDLVSPSNHVMLPPCQHCMMIMQHYHVATWWSHHIIGWPSAHVTVPPWSHMTLQNHAIMKAHRCHSITMPQCHQDIMSGSHHNTIIW